MKFSRISNLLARSFIVFMLAYLWLSFYLSDLLAVFVISFGVMLLVNYMVTLFAKRKNNNAFLTQKQQKHIREVVLQLKFMSKSKIIALFNEALSVKHKTRITQKKVVVENGKKINLFPMFDREITTTDVIFCIRNTNRNSVTYIASESFSPTVITFVKTLNKDIQLLDAVSVYNNILLPAEIFPSVKVEYKSQKKFTWSELRQIVFNRTKVRYYITMGTIILFTSFIVRLSIYYIIIATIVFSFALISLFSRDTMKHEFF